jgi:hypothetical protein
MVIGGYPHLVGTIHGRMESMSGGPTRPPLPVVAAGNERTG